MAVVDYFKGKNREEIWSWIKHKWIIIRSGKSKIGNLFLKLLGNAKLWQDCWTRSVFV